MKFHPRRYSLSRCIKSRDHFAAILSRELSSRLVPLPLPLRPLQSASSQTIVSSCTRRGEFEEKVAQLTTKRIVCTQRHPHFTPKSVYVRGMQFGVARRTHPAFASQRHHARHIRCMQQRRDRCIRFRVQSRPATQHPRHVESVGELVLYLKVCVE